MNETILEINGIATEISNLLIQLKGFMTAFNEVINNNNINVVTDSAGNMSIDVPENMPEELGRNLSKRIGVIDRLITSHGQDLHALFKHGFELEKSVGIGDPSFKSQLSELLEEAQRLNRGYKH